MEQRAIPMISHEDVGAAADWLSRAFGFRQPERFLWPTRDVASRVGHAARELDAEVVLFGATYPLALLGPRLAADGLPYLAAAPVDPSTFLLPPAKARGATETLDMLTELLDVELKAVPGSAGVSERTRALEYLNTQAQWAGSPPSPPSYLPVPFNGDSTATEQTDKIWGLMMLLLEHPDFSRM